MKMEKIGNRGQKKNMRDREPPWGSGKDTKEIQLAEFPASKGGQ